MTKGWPADIPFERSRKRYYHVHADFTRNPSDFELMNPLEALGTKFPFKGGAHECSMPGSSHPVRYGLPELLARPKLFVARQNKPLDAYGLSSILYVSSRAKELLSSIDKGAFEFVECETLSRRSVSIEPYWMVAIARPLVSFDEQKSIFEWAAGEDGVTGEPYVGPHIANFYDIHMPPGLHEDWHAFFFVKDVRQRMVFDQLLIEKWRSNKLSGWTFAPLQPPAPSERRATMAGEHFMYWYGAKYRTAKPPAALKGNQP